MNRPMNSTKVGPPASPSFPDLWRRFFDEVVPAWVKSEYSKKKSLRPEFTEADGRFFSRGVVELSESLTLTRGEHLRKSKSSYFAHPRFRSSYLLYFFPLQAAKFFTLFEQNRQSLLKLHETPFVRVTDFGAGPGTASIALLIWMISQGRPLPEKIELTWIDTDFHILKDGAALLNKFLELEPRLKDRVVLTKKVGPWWSANGPNAAAPSVALFGNVLNEHSGLLESQLSFIENLLENIGPAGAIFMEPADRSSSQLLSRLRDQLVEKGLELAGPCLHHERCPLAMGRDWCHFSTRADLPGKWFSFFSRGLGSERLWLKYSYLWFKGGHPPKSERKTQNKGPPTTLFRVVSDPIKGQDGSSFVLLCTPEKPFKLKIANGRRIYRGDIFKRPR